MNPITKIIAYKCQKCTLEYNIYTNDFDNWDNRKPFCPECGIQSEFSVSLSVTDSDKPICVLTCKEYEK